VAAPRSERLDWLFFRRITAGSPQDHRGTNLSLGKVVLECDVGVVQKREEVLSIATQAFLQASNIGIRTLRTFHTARTGVVVFLGRQLGQSRIQPVNSTLKLAGHEVRPPAQTHSVTQQPAQRLRKGPPLGGIVAQVHLFQLAQQMHQAFAVDPRRTPIRKAPRNR
jgi:hypothetical protein